MKKKLWKLCWRLKIRKLANALAYSEASKFQWKMLPHLTPQGVRENWFQSFVNGWYSKLNMGWTKEIDNPFIDSDQDFERWDIMVRF